MGDCKTSESGTSEKGKQHNDEDKTTLSHGAWMIDDRKGANTKTAKSKTKSKKALANTNEKEEKEKNDNFFAASANEHWDD